MGKETDQGAICRECKARRARERGLCRVCFRDVFPHFVRPVTTALYRDLRAVYAERLPASPTQAQLNLKKMFADSPGKFTDLLKAEEHEHVGRLERAWAESERKNEIDRLAREKASTPAADDTDGLLPEEPVEALIAELLARMREKKA